MDLYVDNIFRTNEMVAAEVTYQFVRLIDHVGYTQLNRIQSDSCP